MNAINRRSFLGRTSLASAGLAIGTGSALTSARLHANEHDAGNFVSFTRDLLADWCDGMLQHQINAPDDPVRHGALGCPSCDFIHGRCWEALYPFLHRAKATGEEKYLDAAIKLFEWSRNVTRKHGAWSNDLNPKSWKGTSIFGAIALAEALHFHGDLLDKKRRAEWTKRLAEAAGGYLWNDFHPIDFTNINYGATAIYGFDLFGRMLGEDKFIQRSREFATEVKRFFTKPNHLLWGEGKPADNRSARGLLPVDLGYNVEESLNGIVLYAIENKDRELLELLTEAMRGHLQFMLPDGAWDNSWGTRQAKWTYWGSRTSDGCQPAFALMAGRDPAFGTAAFLNAELLARCTSGGLLHGGPHYVSHGVKPCIHHTFAHAKVLAFIQDKRGSLPTVDKSTPVPRAVAKGIKHIPELAVWLAARGPWRGTVSAYDSIYRTKSAPEHLQQATGGSLAVLYHEKVGTIFAASMARYIQVEPLNQQDNPGPDFALTPRLESTGNGRWFTNLHDLEAKVQPRNDGNGLVFDVTTTLQDEDRNPAPAEAAVFKLQYRFTDSALTITAAPSDRTTSGASASLVIPVISPSGEPVRRISEHRIEIKKPGATVIIEANVPLEIQDTAKGRTFNMVPGAEAVPIIARLPKKPGQRAECRIAVV